MAHHDHQIKHYMKGGMEGTHIRFLLVSELCGLQSRANLHL